VTRFGGRHRRATSTSRERSAHGDIRSRAQTIRPITINVKIAGGQKGCYGLIGIRSRSPSVDRSSVVQKTQAPHPEDRVRCCKIHAELWRARTHQQQGPLKSSARSLRADQSAGSLMDIWGQEDHRGEHAPADDQRRMQRMLNELSGQAERRARSTAPPRKNEKANALVRQRR